MNATETRSGNKAEKMQRAQPTEVSIIQYTHKITIIVIRSNKYAVTRASDVAQWWQCGRGSLSVTGSSSKTLFPYGHAIDDCRMLLATCLHTCNKYRNYREIIVFGIALAWTVWALWSTFDGCCCICWFQPAKSVRATHVPATTNKTLAN